MTTAPRFKRILSTLAVLVLLGCQPVGLLPGVGTGAKDTTPIASDDGSPVGNPNGIVTNLNASLAGVITGPAYLVSNNAGGLISNNSGGLISNNSGGYRIASLAPAAIAHAVVYLTTPNEQFYGDAERKALYTFTDDKGAYSFKAAPANVPVIVTVLLPGNRRLVGFLIPNKGENAYDVDLATTVVTEFLRDQARLAGKTMADFPALATELPTIIRLTRELIASGQMHLKESDTDDRAGYVDLNVNAIPAMRNEYVRAFAATNQELSDAWKRLLGYRPLLVDEVDVGLAPGMQPIAVTTSGDTVYTAAINAYQLMITKTTGSSPTSLVTVPRTSSGIDYVGGMVASGSHLFLGVSGKAQVEIDATQPSTDLTFDPDAGGSGTGFVQGNGGYAPDPNDPDSWEYFSAFDVALQDSWVYVTSDSSHKLFRYHLDDQGNAVDVQWVAGASLNDASLGYHDGISRNFYNRDDKWRGDEVALNFPSSLTLHEEGDKTYLYFADTDNHRIRRMELNETDHFPVETVLGRGTTAYGNILAPVPDPRIDDPAGVPMTSATFNFPHKVVFDSSGRMFIADTDNRRIRMLDNGVVKTIAGTSAGVSSGSGDSRRLGLGEVSSLAFDRNGDLLIADARSAKLRRLRLPFGF